MKEEQLNNWFFESLTNNIKALENQLQTSHTQSLSRLTTIVTQLQDIRRQCERQDLDVEPFGSHVQPPAITPPPLVTPKSLTPRPSQEHSVEQVCLGQKSDCNGYYGHGKEPISDTCKAFQAQDFKGDSCVPTKNDSFHCPPDPVGMLLAEEAHHQVFVIRSSSSVERSPRQSPRQSSELNRQITIPSDVESNGSGDLQVLPSAHNTTTNRPLSAQSYRSCLSARVHGQRSDEDANGGKQSRASFGVLEVVTAHSGKTIGVRSMEGCPGELSDDGSLGRLPDCHKARQCASICSLEDDSANKGATPNDASDSVSYPSDREKAEDKFEYAHSSSQRTDDDETFEVLNVWMDQKWRKTRRTTRVGETMAAPEAQKLGHGMTMSLRESATKVLDPDDFKMQERRRRSRCGCLQTYVIKSTSSRLLCWHFLGLALLCYDFLMVPMKVYETTDTTSSYKLTLEFVFALYWPMDMVVNCFTEYLDAQGNQNRSLVDRLIRYVKSWLLFDAVCLVIDVATLLVDNEIVVSSSLRVLSGAKILRCVKIAQLLGSPAIDNLMSGAFGQEELVLGFQMVQSMLGLLGVAHLNACLWYGIGHFPMDGIAWIMDLPQNHTTLERHLVSLHWSIAQFVGELIIAPSNNRERSYVILVTFATFLMSGLFVSSIVTALSRMQQIKSLQATRMSSLRKFVVENEVPTPLAVRIFHNAYYVSTAKRSRTQESSVELLKEMSNPLVVELHFYIRGSLLLNHQFFLLYYDINSIGLEKVCHTTIDFKSPHKGESVFSSFAQAENMYFVQDGHLSYRRGNCYPIMLHEGNWAAEHVLWTHWVHCGTLSAETESSVMMMDPTKFADILGPFPTRHAQLYAGAFVMQLNSQDPANHTDLRFNKTMEHEMLTTPFPNLLLDEESEQDSDTSEVIPTLTDADPGSRMRGFFASAREIMSKVTSLRSGGRRRRTSQLRQSLQSRLSARSRTSSRTGEKAERRRASEEALENVMTADVRDGQETPLSHGPRSGHSPYPSDGVQNCSLTASQDDTDTPTPIHALR
eukprot:TRINITY_DN10561_c0_g1_i1.p1 TRINITY_DN10561_c0_g1~~TRINITY_DN10561_c0_g1_i1.p1  ORF type:complete len:1038 (+),score=143.59 TRINITY_DN10561_c0_g1_i1:144-3257(+)